MFYYGMIYFKSTNVAVLTSLSVFMVTCSHYNFKITLPSYDMETTDLQVSELFLKNDIFPLLFCPLSHFFYLRPGENFLVTIGSCCVNSLLTNLVAISDRTAVHDNLTTKIFCEVIAFVQRNF